MTSRIAHIWSLLRRRFWWFDVIYPVALAGAVCVFITILIYSGPTHRQIASYWENKLLTFSLQNARPISPNSDTPVRIVSFEESDTAMLTASPYLRDAHVTSYAQVVRRAVDLGANFIVISWTPAAHMTTTEYYQPLIDAVSAVTDRAAVIIAYPQLKSWTLPVALQTSGALFVDDLSCSEPQEIVCPYFPDTQDWAVQVTVTKAMERSQRKISALQASDNLTQPVPAFVVDILPAKELQHWSFQQLLAAAHAPNSLANHMVFVGSNLVQRAEVENKADLIRRVWTVHNQPHGVLRAEGTPLHVFWGQLAEQVINRDFIAVAPAWVTALLAFLLSASIFGVLLRHGAAAALGSFLVLMGSAPLLNAFALRSAAVYVPLFGMLYAGGLTFLFAGFGMLSYTAYARSRVEAQVRSYGRTADLKGNFISLLSHNLNTPIAKMQGLLEVLNNLTIETDLRQDLTTAFSRLGRMQLTVRAVLVATALSENARHDETLRLNMLLDEFLDNHRAWLGRLGISFGSRHQEFPEGQITTLHADKRAVLTCLTAMAALFSLDGEPGSLELTAALDDSDSERPCVVLHWQSSVKKPWPEPLQKQLATASHKSPRMTTGSSIYADILGNLLDSMAQVYGWTFIRRLENGARFAEVRLPVAI